MRYKLYWGLGILIVLFIGAFMFVMVNQFEKNKQLEAELEKAQKLADQIEERKAAENNPPVAREGFKMVQHGDHWHEVPIDAPDVWQGEPHEPKSQDPLPDMSKYKIDLPDEIPDDFPTEAELQEMDSDHLLHLAKLYTKESNELRITDFDAGIRLYNATIPILYKILDEKSNKADAIIEAMDREHRKEFPVPRYIPATEDSSAVFIDVIPLKRYQMKEKNNERTAISFYLYPCSVICYV